MNIIYREPFKKTYCVVIMQIVKNDGCCHNKDGLLRCAYLDKKNNEFCCNLFTDIVVGKNSLFICNLIYTPTYIGNP